MDAVVLLKQILDWELPPREFRIDPATKSPPADLGPRLLGPFEENALELALQLKEAGIVERITVVLAGAPAAIDILRKAFAVGADDAILVEEEHTGPGDPSQTAALLTRAVQRLGSPEIVLAGRQAGDWDHGQVGYLVAERLGRPAIGLVWRVERRADRLHIWRIGVGGVERLAVRPPVVMTVTNHDSLRLRGTSVSDLLKARAKPIESWATADLGVTAEEYAAARRLEVSEVWIPEARSVCEFVEGNDPRDVARHLLGRLADLKLIGSPG